MRIDYNWGKPPVKRSDYIKEDIFTIRTELYILRLRLKRWFKRVFAHKPVPLHMSNHYVREHFHPEDNPQRKLF